MMHAVRLTAIILAVSTSLCAQITTGSISGHLFDPSGKAVARSAVIATDVLRSFTRETFTDDFGFYRFPDIAPSTYEISASAPGFSKSVIKGVKVTVNAHLRVDLQLPLAGPEQSIEVTSQAQQILTESSEQSMVLSRQRIESLPLNRRDFLQLSLLAPGSFPPVEDSELSSRSAFAMHANGGRETFNNFLLDGVDNNDPYVGRYVLQPSVDSIEEFKIATNSYSAQYGRSAAGQVNVITRQGTNELHGSVYEYFRNATLDARNFFDGSDKNKFNRNQFGLAVGGPLIPGRAFFFANADFLRERQGMSRLGTVPTAEQRNGNLSSLSTTIIDPFTRQPFPGNIIPQERISDIARQVLDLFPPANLPGTAGNYSPSAVAKDDETQLNFRVDYRLSDKDDLSLRYSRGHADLYEPYTEGTDTVPGFGDNVADSAHNAMIQYRHFFGSKTGNSLQLGFNRFSRELMQENKDKNVGQLWGVSWLDVPSRDYGYPIMNVAGFSRIGDATSLPLIRRANTYQISDTLSLSRGKHLFHLGGEIRRLQLNSILDLLTRGSLSFSGFISGSGISDLLLGYPSFTLQAQADNPIALRSTAYNVFLQDEWKIRRNLTLNLGLRYEYNTPPVDPQNRMYTFDLKTESIVRVGTNGISRSGTKPDRNNFAPRIGFAWNPTRDILVRGGYGLYYDAGYFEVNSAQYFNPPQFNLNVFFPSQYSLLTLENPFPVGKGFTPPPSLTALNSDIAGAYLQHWSLGIEHNFGSLGTVGISYVGSKGTHLTNVMDLNQPVPGPGAVQPRRPYPQYSGIMYIGSGANSNFNSMQLSFNRPLLHGISIWAAYSFSKSIDNASAFRPTKADPNFPQDSRNIQAERGLSSFDMPHRFKLAYIFRLPNKNRWTQDTEFRGITTIQSGQPFTPVLRFDNSNTGNGEQTTGSDRPNLLHDPRISNPSNDHWFDTSAFAVAPQYEFGNAGRNILRGPAFASFDLSLVRSFRMMRSVTLQFEAQSFNLFNRTNFDLPELYADEPNTFGKIFSAKAPRQMQFALRLSF